LLLANDHQLAILLNLIIGFYLLSFYYFPTRLIEKFIMAANTAAVPSVVGGRPERRSPPPTASQSKRDRKRQVLLDRLAAMNEKFQRDRDTTYREQLQKIQLDTNLVQRFDPYDQRALEIISDLQKEHKESQAPTVNAESARSLLDMAGPKFLSFIEEVEDLIEVRDFQLTQSKVCPLSECAHSSQPIH
jgi:hypothetical protein